MTGFLQQGGGYRKLKVFKITEIIFDLSMVFAARHVRPGSRTRDQIEQAARSGKQNIAEGSKASTTSRETEIKLTNVALASLDELLNDYEDHLRVNGLLQWGKDYPRTLRLRQYVKTQEFEDNPLALIEKMNVEEFCNLCITLINQATYMLRRLRQAQEQQFLEQGGIREQMYRARLAYRDNQRSGGSGLSDKSDRSDKSDSNPRQS